MTNYRNTFYYFIMERYSHLLEVAADFEEGVLKALLWDPSCVDVAIARLTPEYFQMKKYSVVYTAIFDLYTNQSKLPHLHYVAKWLSNSEYFELWEGWHGVKKFLIDLHESHIGSSTIDVLVEGLLENYADLKIYWLGEKVKEVSQDSVLTTEEKQEEIEYLTMEITDARKIAQPEKPSKTASELLQDAYDYVGGVVDGNGKTRAIATGFYDLDAKLNGGLHGGDLVIVAGRPSMGKSSFMAQLAWNAGKANKKTLVFTLEMSHEQMGVKYLSSLSEVDSNLLYSGKVSASHWDKLSQHLLDGEGVDLEMYTTFDISWEGIVSKVKRHQNLKGKVDLIVIDYLQLLLDSDDPMLTHKIGAITRKAKLFANENDIPVVLLSQLSRAVEQGSNKRPQLSHIRQSGSVEQDADKIVFLYRDEYYNPDTPDRGIAELIVAKHRNGGVGTIKLLFEPHTTTFKNLARSRSN